MIAVICLLFPTLLVGLIKHKYESSQCKLFERTIIYLTNIVLTNVLMILILYVMFNNYGQLVYKLNHHINFACKYFALATVLAVLGFVWEKQLKIAWKWVYCIINKNKEIVSCLVTAIIVIFICSRSSPLYPLNDWVDSNCFFTVGKSMLSGKIPYRDLIEQKGPLLYMMHALAALISYKTFLGVYFLEVIACCFFLLLCRKILELYLSISSLLYIPIIAAVIYSANSFVGGDSAEEFCLPLIAYCIYCTLRSLKSKQALTFFQGFFIGITSACVLWIKYNLLGFYVGWVIAYFTICIYNRTIRTFIKTIFSILIGVVVLSLPIFLYFVINHGVMELFTVYFFDNLFSYALHKQPTGIRTILYNLYLGYKTAWSNSTLILIITYIGIIGTAFAGRRREFLILVLSFFGSFSAIYFGKVRHTYYSFILAIFVPIGFVYIENCIYHLQSKVTFKQHACQLLSICVLGFFLLFTYMSTGNIRMMDMRKNSMPQYKFAKIISRKDDATLLNYGFLDGGFYTVTGIVPNCPYFCRLNIPNKEMMKTQERYVNEGLVDFIVTRNLELKTGLYKCISKAEMFGAKYYLYQIKSEVVKK